MLFASSISKQFPFIYKLYMSIRQKGTLIFEKSGFVYSFSSNENNAELKKCK